jgi:hypothetical protein
MDSNKSLDSKPNNKDKLSLKNSEGKSQDSTQLRFCMVALQQLVDAKGSVASIFANTVSKAQTSGKVFFEDFNTAIADIFHGDENLNPDTLTTALEQDASEGRAYLIMINDDVGFTLLHNLQCMDCKIWPGDPISSKVVAGNAIDKEEGNIFLWVHLPPCFSCKPSIITNHLSAMTRNMPLSREPPTTRCMPSR